MISKVFFNASFDFVCFSHFSCTAVGREDPTRAVANGNISNRRSMTLAPTVAHKKPPTPQGGRGRGITPSAYMNFSLCFAMILNGFLGGNTHTQTHRGGRGITAPPPLHSFSCSFCDDAVLVFIGQRPQSNPQGGRG